VFEKNISYSEYGGGNGSRLMIDTLSGSERPGFLPEVGRGRRRLTGMSAGKCFRCRKFVETLMI